MDMKERMAQATERRRKRRLHLENEALEKGVEDVATYVAAHMELDFGGGEADDLPDDPFLPSGQSLH